jgi:hypothetical protein
VHETLLIACLDPAASAQQPCSGSASSTAVSLHRHTVSNPYTLNVQSGLTPANMKLALLPPNSPLTNVAYMYNSVVCGGCSSTPLVNTPRMTLMILAKLVALLRVIRNSQVGRLETCIPGYPRLQRYANDLYLGNYDGTNKFW